MNGHSVRLSVAIAALFALVLGCSESGERLEQPGKDHVGSTNNPTETTDFNWPEDFTELVQIENSGLSTEQFNEWAFGHQQWIAERFRRRLTDQEVDEIIGQSILLDCRKFERSKKLDSSIQDASNLTWLRLSDDYTKPDLGWVLDLKQLKGLSLCDVDLEKENLSGLDQLKNLQWLEVTLNQDGHNAVPFPPGIEVLIMNGPGVTDHDLPNGGKLPKLKYLSLRDSQVTDMGINKLSQSFPRLIGLDLGFCDVISSDCVASLANFSKLQYLYLNHTPLERHTEYRGYSMIAELQRVLPHCHIRINER